MGYYPKTGINPDPDPEPVVDTYDVSFNVSADMIPSGTVNVENATVTIGDLSGRTGSAGGCTVQNVPEGEHTVTVSCNGYTTYTETIQVDSTHTSFNIKITAEDITVTLTVHPDNSDTDAPSVITDAVITDMNSETVNIPFTSEGTLTINLKPGAYYITYSSPTYGVESSDSIFVSSTDTSFDLYIYKE